MRVVSQYIAKKHNAGPKAKVDVEKILKDKFNAKIYTNKVKNEESTFFEKIKKVIFNIIALKTKDMVIVQVPYTNKKKFLKLAKNKIAIIHDIDGIRFNDDKLLEEEIDALNDYKCVIVHNNQMKEYLQEKGLNTKIEVLELFDYLCESEEIIDNHIDIENPKIIYIGNLEKRKANFLYEVDNEKMNYTLNTYGANLEENNNSKLVFKGSYAPDVLPSKLEGDLGLVWSGEADESDENLSEKNYNKFNSPHKISCYIAAGVPVVIWKKAACAELVEKYNIGYTINNLYELNNIDLHDYEEKKKNILELSKKVREGYFTKTVIEKVLNK